MANTFYTEVEYLDEAITSFGEKLSPIGALSTKFEGEIKGTSITVPLASCGEGAEYAGTYAVDDSVLAEISVDVTHVFKSFKIDVKEASESAAATLKNLYKVNLDALAAKVQSVALADMANFTLEHEYVTNFTWDSVKAGLATADNLPEDGKVMILKSALNTALLPSVANPTVIDAADYDLQKFVNSKLPVDGVITHAGAYAVGLGLPSNPLIGTNALIDHEILDINGMKVLFTVHGSGDTGTIRGVFSALVGGKIAQDEGVYFEESTVD